MLPVKSDAISRARLIDIFLENNADPDQMPHYAASDLSLHCLPRTLFKGKSGLKSYSNCTLLPFEGTSFMVEDLNFE